MKPKVLGYIVTTQHGPLELSKYDHPTLLLTHGDSVTIFPDYAAAQAALKRTRRYSEKYGLRWETWARWRIMPVHAQKESEAHLAAR